MMSIAANIQAIRARMDAAAARAGRDPGEILLVGIAYDRDAEKRKHSCVIERAERQKDCKITGRMLR